MVIVGVLLIMAVLLDAWRRIRREKSSKIKVKLVNPDDLPAAPIDDLRQYRELPNGGARVVERGDILRAAGFGSRVASSSSSRMSSNPRILDSLAWSRRYVWSLLTPIRPGKINMGAGERAFVSVNKLDSSVNIRFLTTAVVSLLCCWSPSSSSSCVFIT